MNLVLQAQKLSFRLALLLFFIAALHPESLMGQSNDNVTDDGSFVMYTYIEYDGSSISAFSGDPTPDDFLNYATYNIEGEPTWTLSGDNYSDGGAGDSFSSGPVPTGSTYTAAFYYSVIYYYYGYAAPENPTDCGGIIYGDGDYCEGYDEPSGNASIYVPLSPPQITAISKSSVQQEEQGVLAITGINLVGASGDQISVSLNGNGGPFSVSGLPTATTATFIYNFASYPAGTYTLTVTNNQGTSNGVTFTVTSKWPTNPCDVGSSPKSQYSAFAATGTSGAGAVTVSFSGAAYSAVNQTVPYGPFSTPSSIAAHMAALITANYSQYGLTARAFGPNVVYSGTSEVGAVSHAITGSSITTLASSAAEASAGMACSVAPPTPAPTCGVPSQEYVLTVLNDSVIWKEDGYNRGRFVNYSLQRFPTKPGKMGQAVTFYATVTEHLTRPMSSGFSSDGDAGAGTFYDVLGNLGVYNSGTYTADRCFTVRSSVLGSAPVHVLSYDQTGMRGFDHIQISLPNGPSILNYWTNTDGSPKDISILP